MAYATGKYALAICDRCGFKYKFSRLREEWNGLKTCPTCFEPKHPQIRRKRVVADAIALQNPRSQDFNINSGGKRYTTIDLTLPGMFAFNSNGMQPDDGAAQNRNRGLNTSIGSVTISIT